MKNPMSKELGIKMYERLISKFGKAEVRLVKWDNVTHIYFGNRYFDTFEN